MVQAEIMAIGSIIVAVLVALALAKPTVKSRSAIIIIKVVTTKIIRATAATSTTSNRTTVTAPGLAHVHRQKRISNIVVESVVGLVGTIEGTG